MQFDWSTLVLQTVNFAILVWLLHRFLYRPVLRMVDARRAEVDKQYMDAKAAEAKAKEQLASIVSERTSIAGERTAALKAAAAQAEEAATARHAQAERDAAALLDSTRKTLAHERDEALAQVHKAALDLGADIAVRLLAEVPIKLRGEAWLERVVEYLVGIAPADRQSLLQQLVPGTALRVVSASALPPESGETWRAQLQQALGGTVAVAFEVDPDLIAGVELHFPNAVLRFSWRSTLASVRAELEAHGKTG